MGQPEPRHLGERDGEFLRLSHERLVPDFQHRVPDLVELLAGNGRAHLNDRAFCRQLSAHGDDQLAVGHKGVGSLAPAADILNVQLIAEHAQPLVHVVGPQDVALVEHHGAAAVDSPAEGVDKVEKDRVNLLLAGLHVEKVLVVIASRPDGLVEPLELLRHPVGVVHVVCHAALETENRGLDVGGQSGGQDLVLLEAGPGHGLHKGGEVPGEGIDPAGMHLVLPSGVGQLGAHQVDADIGPLAVGDADVEGLFHPPGDIFGDFTLPVLQDALRVGVAVHHALSAAEPLHRDGQVDQKAGVIAVHQVEIVLFLGVMDDFGHLSHIGLGFSAQAGVEPLQVQTEHVDGVAQGHLLLLTLAEPFAAQGDEAGHGGAALLLAAADFNAAVLPSGDAQAVLLEPAGDPGQVLVDDALADVKLVGQELERQVVVGGEEELGHLQAALVVVEGLPSGALAAQQCLQFVFRVALQFKTDAQPLLAQQSGAVLQAALLQPELNPLHVVLYGSF